VIPQRQLPQLLPRLRLKALQHQPTLRQHQLIQPLLQHQPPLPRLQLHRHLPNKPVLKTG
jgi:hypothetical protein